MALSEIIVDPKTLHSAFTANRAVNGPTTRWFLCNAHGMHPPDGPHIVFKIKSAKTSENLGKIVKTTECVVVKVYNEN